MNSNAGVRFRFRLPLAYVILGTAAYVMFGADPHDWGPEPLYLASLPAVLLVRATGLIAPHSIAAMFVTYAAGVVQYGLLGLLIDRLPVSEGKKRIAAWTIPLALVGAMLKTKETLRPDAIIGALIGGLIGFCIGLLITVLKKGER